MLFLTEAWVHLFSSWLPSSLTYSSFLFFPYPVLIVCCLFPLPDWNAYGMTVFSLSDMFGVSCGELNTQWALTECLLIVSQAQILNTCRRHEFKDPKAYLVLKNSILTHACILQFAAHALSLKCSAELYILLEISLSDFQTYQSSKCTLQCKSNNEVEHAAKLAMSLKTDFLESRPILDFFSS